MMNRTDAAAIKRRIFEERLEANHIGGFSAPDDKGNYVQVITKAAIDEADYVLALPEPESNPFDVKPGPVSLHDYDRLEQIAIELLRLNPKNEKGLFDAALAVYMAENPDRPQISPSNAEARRRIRRAIQHARQARIDAE